MYTLRTINLIHHGIFVVNNNQLFIVIVRGLVLYYIHINSVLSPDCQPSRCVVSTMLWTSLNTRLIKSFCECFPLTSWYYSFVTIKTL